MEKKNTPTASSTIDRKTIEKNRRNEMKSLYSRLHSFVPHTHASRDTVLSVADKLGEATSYIRKLQAKVEEMKHKKERLMVMGLAQGSKNTTNACGGGGSDGVLMKSMPLVEIQETGTALGVALTTGLLDHQFLFRETIRILHEGGAEIINAAFSVIDEDIVSHVIHSQVQVYEMGYGASAMISERLKKFVLDYATYYSIA